MVRGSVLYRALVNGDLAILDLIGRCDKNFLGIKNDDGLTPLGLAILKDINNSMFHLLCMGSDPLLGKSISHSYTDPWISFKSGSFISKPARFSGLVGKRVTA